MLICVIAARIYCFPSVNKYTVFDHVDCVMLWNLKLYTYKMSHVTIKPVFGVCNQVRLKLTCSATEASQRHEIANIETRGNKISKQQTTKVLIRLCRFAGWFAPLLFAYGITGFLVTWLKSKLPIFTQFKQLFLSSWFLPQYMSSFNYNPLMI